MSADEASRMLSLFKASIMRISPFLYFSMNAFNVYYVDEDHRAGIVVDSKGNIKIYRNILQDSKAFGPRLIKTLIHGVMAHPQRAKLMKKKYLNVLNIDEVLRFAADVVAYRLYPENLRRREFIVEESLLAKILGGDWKELSFEEIVRRLLDNGVRIVAISVTSGDEVEFDEEKREAGERAVVKLQEGELSKVGNKDLEGMIKAIEELAKRNALRATIAGEGAGTERVDSIRKLIEDLLKEKPLSWHLILRRFLQGWMRKNFISSWRILSRKSDDLPGLQMMTKPRIIVAVDVSGSISDEEYSRFVREILGMLKISEVRFICWDVTAKDYGEVRKPDDLVSRKEVRGYGGTQITSLKPVLEKLKVGPGDLLIVMTDGEWVESEDEVREFLRSLRCSKILLLERPWNEHKGFDLTLKIGERE